MRKIAPEIENLMWSIAESDNQLAIDEFEGRFPELRIELSKRITMVRGLRRNRPETLELPAIPRFTPAPPTYRRSSMPTYAIALACSLIATCALAYMLSSNFQSKPMVIARPAPTRLGPLVLPEPIVKNKLPTVQNPTPNIDPGLPPTRLPEREPAPQKWAINQSVIMSDAPLLTVAKAVARVGGLSLEIAPGMPNPSIQVDYEGVNAADILKDLGRKYSFTPMLSDDGSVILIPAVADDTRADPNAAPHLNPNSH